MSLSLSLTATEGLALGAGLVQGALALVFWKGASVRRAWGLPWLAAAFASAALINMPGPLGRVGEAPWETARTAFLYLFGVLTLGALVVGISQFVGRRVRRPLLLLGGAIVSFLALVLLQRALGVPASVVGHLAASVLFSYLAIISLAGPREGRGIGNGIVFVTLLLYPLLVLGAAAWRVDGAELRGWAAVPYTLIGVGTLVAALIRYHAELSEELARREKAEAELRQINASLEDRVEARTAELRDMVGGLESFNRMVSHDLRGPLGGLAGAAALTRQAVQRGDTARADHMLALIENETTRLAALVAELLALARIGHVDLARHPTPLDEVLDQALHTVALSAPGQAPLALEREPLPSANVDAGLLRQVFVNLLTNAHKFTRGRDAPRVSVKARRTANELVIDVRDNGVGFAPERAAELFQPFRRLHGAQFEGSGVGLTIARRIVERHGGRVWAEGRPGEGATFSFSLPR